MFVASTVYQQFVAKFKQHVEATLVVSIDTLPEWSKGVDSSSTSESCVGSNPTAVISFCSTDQPSGVAEA